MTSDKAQRRSADELVETTLPATFAQNAPSVAMSEVQYSRLKQQIRASPTGAATSIWLALAGACAGVAATILVGALTGSVTASAKGQLEVGAWAGFAVAAIFLVVHVVHYRQARESSEAIITELDSYILRRGPPHNDETKESPRSLRIP
jgi:hypothetical protein